ncbi:TadE/TadG family type IV pilus assembly protein [Allosphingosinicella humi]
MERRRPSHLFSDCSAAAAAEMALVAPLLMILLFGAMELGRYFLDEHVVAKAVRDGARYAARRSFADYAGCAVSSDVQDKTRNITRTGQVATGGNARLPYWTSPATVTVSVACDTSGTYGGIYSGSATGAPVVSVIAAVPYTPLFNAIGFNVSGLSLNARSQSAVTGI